jgi:hypothetical protein
MPTARRDKSGENDEVGQAPHEFPFNPGGAGKSMAGGVGGELAGGFGGGRNGLMEEGE